MTVIAVCPVAMSETTKAFRFFTIIINDLTPEAFIVNTTAEFVCELKEIIYNQIDPLVISQYRARHVVLWKLKEPIPISPDKTVLASVQEAGDLSQIANALRETDVIANLFPDPNSTGHLYIVATLVAREPPAGSETVKNEERAHRKAVEMAKTAPSPSSISKSPKLFKAEQADRPIYNGRPAGRRGPPVAIYHTAFAELKDALRDVTKVVDNAEDQRVDDTAKLSLVATDIYNLEDERSKAIIPYLKNLLGIDLIEKAKVKNGKKEFESDAIATEAIEDVTYGEKEAIIGHVEFKNEFGIGGDGGVQNVLGLRKHLAQEEYNEVRNASCCPCITVTVAGPYISFGGAILADAFIVESFTDYIYLGRKPSAQEWIIHLARTFAAVAQAFLSLKRFYQDLKLKPAPDLYRLFPSPTYFADRMPQTEMTFTARFNYEGRESDDYRRSLFRATYGDKEVLVKFCERYHRDGHRIVAAANYAPELFFCEQIQGGVTMVIMKFIAGQDAYYRFKNVDLPSDILENVMSAVEVLHDAGLVFGDLRRPNIVIDKTGGRERPLLIDFEWVGQDGQARYPALLNDSGEITWATGVKPHAIMRKEHDIEMVRKLNVY
ncbi:hypothetical protein D9615_001578 [Tricholomella constricta]|uniref:Protein kinase domain-containing protein n=1 Tax=Tricholomella constricta TaxID=117010 RepID=A0A8H5HPB1_9AGAR|nr:hypothetical protein D9615_001578 [Tricholomella constricta]